MSLAFKARVDDPTIASYRYRVLTPIAFLAARGHAVELFDEARFDAYDAVVFSKAYKAEDQALARRLKAAGRKVLLDLCDDHFFNPEGLKKYDQARQDLLAMIALADRVVCSTPVLARTVQAEATLPEPPAVAPDVYEQSAARVRPAGPPEAPARLLWFGRHGSPNAEAGMGDLELIRDALAEACRLRPFELVVCSDSRERFDALAADFPAPLAYVDWTHAGFDAVLADVDAVLIPLSQNRFVAAKTHNRLSLALSAGVPVIADPLDAYAEFEPFCWLDDWQGGLEAVLLRPEEARERAAGAKAYLESRWSAEAIAPLWEAALGLTASSEPDMEAVSTVDPGAPVPTVQQWISRQRRGAAPWILAGEAADPEAVQAARAAGAMVMTLGPAIRTLAADVALILDAEVIAVEAAAIEANAGVLAVPSDLHSRGWASGRSLQSWASDLPVLRRLRDAGRLVQFDLWSGDRDGVLGDLEGEEIPLRLLAQAKVREIRGLGVLRPAPASSGLEGLTSILERTRGDVGELLRRTGISYVAED